MRTSLVTVSSRPSPFRRSIACVMIAALIVTLMPKEASARWHDMSGSLPGLVSGKSILLLAIAGGAAVAGMIVWSKRKGRTSVQLQIQPPRFNQVAVGESDRQSVGITNLMGDPITIKEVALEGKATSFSLTEARQVPFTVAPGERVEIPIHYAPRANGGSNGRVRIVATSPRVQKATVKVVGFSAAKRRSEARLSSDAGPLAAAVAVDLGTGAAAIRSLR